MATILAPGLCRFTVHGAYAGRPVANIVDMKIDTTGSIVSRDDAIAAQAGIIINEWSDHVLALVADNYTAQSVSWVDLDSLNGSTGQRSVTDQETWPQPGGNAAVPMPGNVAYRVNKGGTARRGQRSGRMYLVGVPEIATDDLQPNRPTAATITSMNINLASLLGNIEQSDGGTEDYTSEWHVIHTANDEFVSSSRVTSLTLDSILGSQRRRLRG